MTPNLSQRAARLCIYANAARKAKRASTEKTRRAIKTTALVMIYDLRRAGAYVPKKHEQALRGQ